MDMYVEDLEQEADMLAALMAVGEVLQAKEERENLEVIMGIYDRIIDKLAPPRNEFNSFLDS